MDPMMGKPPDGQYDWPEMHAYQSPPLQSPAQEYGGYGFTVSPHDMTPESPYGRHPQHMYGASQQPQQIFPAQWPSMLTNASMQGHGHPPQPQIPPHTATQISLQPPIAPLTSINAPHAPPHVTPLATPQPQTAPARRTLTDQDRRRMCQYHEDNPSVKQTEIGAMFGVERSTVSKVLRQKEKYLFPEDGSRSPIKKAKGKFPDIERALSNWARNYERKGVALSDKDIREKARFFAATVGSVDSYDKLNSTTWIEKFKQKNGLLGAKVRKASDANESDAGNEKETGAQTPNGVSPTSPGGLASQSPISPHQGNDKIKTEPGSNHYAKQLASDYNRAHSQSATSLASAQSDSQVPSTLSNQAQSPVTSFYSSDASVSGSQYPNQQAQIMMNAANAHRIRSQTFPTLGLDPAFQSMPSGQSGALTPKQMHDIMSAPTLETPVDDYPDRCFPLSNPELGHLSRSSSNIHSPAPTGSPSIIAPPPNPVTPSTGAPSTISSPLAPPSQDEARRALELVMHFFQHQPSGVVDPEEYITMGKLMEKLKVQGSVGELPGGMRSLDPQQEASRKRSIHSL